MSTNAPSTAPPTAPEEKEQQPQPQPPTKKRQLELADTADAAASAKKDPSAPAAAATATPGDGAETLVDVCNDLGLKAGDRVEVKWDLHVESADDTNDDAKTVPKWWGATLLQPDGRTHTLKDDGDGPTAPSPGVDASRDIPSPGSGPADTATVPIRTLDYDPCPEFGFAERSLEDVAFLSDHSVLNLGTGTRAHYRREGTDWEPTTESEQIGPDGLLSAARAAAAGASEEGLVEVQGEEGIRSVLDVVLQSALANTSRGMDKLDPAQQRHVADKIATAKERLLVRVRETLEASDDGVLTVDKARVIMEELGREL